MKLIFLSNQTITEKAIQIFSIRKTITFVFWVCKWEKKLIFYLIFAQQKIYFENMIKKCQPFACNVFQLWQEHSLIHTEWLLINRLTGMIIALIKIKERLIMKKIFSIIFFKPSCYSPFLKWLVLTMTNHRLGEISILFYSVYNPTSIFFSFFLSICLTLKCRKRPCN